MASGIEVCDSVKNMLITMKMTKNTDERIRLAIFTIVDKKRVDVTKTYQQKDLGDNTVFSILSKEMDESKCFYALYDCNFQTKENVDKDELVFITWTSDADCIKNKMIYASSRDSVKGCMTGVKHNLQLNERSDWTRKTVAEKIQETNSQTVTKIENMDI